MGWLGKAIGWVVAPQVMMLGKAARYGATAVMTTKRTNDKIISKADELYFAEKARREAKKNPPAPPARTAEDDGLWNEDPFNV